MSEPDEPPPRRLAQLRALLQELGPAAPLFLVAVLGPVVGAVALAATSGHWLSWFGADAGSVVTFWLVGATLAASCLVPTHATSLVAGYLFGGALGAVIAWLVVLLAAAVGFAIWHRLCGARAVRVIERSPNAMRVHLALLGRGFWRTTWLIALLRLSPLLPFAATNLLLAAFGVRPAAFLLATIVGVAPRAIGVAFVGSELSELDWSAGGNVWSTVLAVAATLAAVVVVGRIAREALARETRGAVDDAA
jgi:uncharacterized membrane protein YdjX (TVP38/TMEM64 family)